MFIEGQKVKVILDKVLSETGNKPNLKVNEEYTIHKIVLDKKGNQHLDVGLKSNLSYVSSLETGEELPEGHTIHWCHPSRFEIIE